MSKPRTMVERLRDTSWRSIPYPSSIEELETWHLLCCQAADRIAELEKENERLAALCRDLVAEEVEHQERGDTTKNDMLAVGKEVGGNTHFIAAPTERYEISRGAISGKVCHMLILEREELPWLIEALQHEIDLVEEEDEEMQSSHEAHAMAAGLDALDRAMGGGE